MIAVRGAQPRVERGAAAGQLEQRDGRAAHRQRGPADLTREALEQLGRGLGGAGSDEHAREPGFTCPFEQLERGPSRAPDHRIGVALRDLVCDLAGQRDALLATEAVGLGA